MKALTTRLGSLNTRVLHSGREDLRPELAVILCHGYGAPGDDLVGLCPEVVAKRPELAERVRWYFPEAPLSLGSYGFMEGRAWWHLDMERLMEIQRGDTSGMERYRTEVPSGLSEARRALWSVVDEISRATGLGIDRLVLGGFSQGAMLATDLSLRLEEPPAALAIFSGAPIAEGEWLARAPGRKGLRVLQSHGKGDPVLPFSGAEHLRALLVGAGLSVDFVPFDGPHTIPYEAIERLSDLLSTLLAR